MRNLDLVLVTTMMMLVGAKMLTVPPELGVPAAFAAAIANAWHV